MPATVNVNFLTVVHAGSGGVAMSFPDVCKTPTPGGPVPIPYPNIAQSSDTADGSSTVKVDGNPIMLKSSNFRMSSGDEAGSALGVASNKIKGKALPINTSFDVKVDGKNVFRLTDPMQTNAGSANSMNPAEVQGPQPPGFLMSKECEKLKESKEKQGKEIAKKNSGMLPEHFDKILEVAKEMKVVIYFRQTESVCHPWIRKFHQPKPHAIFKGNTIKHKLMDPKQPEKGTMVEWVQKWLDEYAKKPGAEINAYIPTQNTQAAMLATNAFYSAKAETYLGVIGGTSFGPGKVKPLKSIKEGIRDSGISYWGKWVTGDYDIFHIIKAEPGCQQVNQNGRSFTRIRAAINQKLKWDAVQHGPQTQWIASDHDVELGAPPGVNFPNKVKSGFKNNDPEELVPISGRKGMKVFDENVTVVSPSGCVFLEKQKDTFDALKCRECDKNK